MTKDTTRRSGLGRGLSALFAETAIEEAATPRPTAHKLPIEFLEPGKYQPRRAFDDEALDQLASSVRERGILQPILVRRLSGPLERYEIVAGERRWRAAQKAGLHEVPVLVRELDDLATLEIALIENLQRQDLSPLEESEGYKRLMDEFNHTQDELAKAVGKSRSHVANMLRLLNLPDPVKSLVQAGDLSAGHARALLTSSDPVALAREVVRRGLNVRQTEDLAKQGGGAGAAKKQNAAATQDPNIAELERTLADQLGVKVTITQTGEGMGEIRLVYQNLDKLDAVLARLRG